MLGLGRDALGASLPEELALLFYLDTTDEIRHLGSSVCK